MLVELENVGFRRPILDLDDELIFSCFLSFVRYPIIASYLVNAVITCGFLFAALFEILLPNSCPFMKIILLLSNTFERQIITIAKYWQKKNCHDLHYDEPAQKE